MLSKRQNLLETIHGGNPDRYVNQFEAFKMAMGSPMSKLNPRLKKGDMLVKNAWGVYKSFPENVPGAFPVHDAEHVVIKDITRWREYVTIPPTKFPDEEWAPFEQRAAEIDTNEFFRTVVLAQGRFAEFLNSNENDKAALLEKMTGTEVYSQIGMKIHEVEREKKGIRDNLLGQLQNITLLNDDEKAEISGEMTRLRDELTGVNQQREQAKKMADWLDKKEQNEKALAEKSHSGVFPDNP